MASPLSLVETKKKSVKKENNIIAEHIERIEYREIEFPEKSLCDVISKNEE